MIKINKEAYIQTRLRFDISLRAAPFPPFERAGRKIRASKTKYPMKMTVARACSQFESGIKIGSMFVSFQFLSHRMSTEHPRKSFKSTTADFYMNNRMMMKMINAAELPR